MNITDDIMRRPLHDILHECDVVDIKIGSNSDGEVHTIDVKYRAPLVPKVKFAVGQRYIVGIGKYKDKLIEITHVGEITVYYKVLDDSADKECTGSFAYGSEFANHIKQYKSPELQF